MLVSLSDNNTDLVIGECRLFGINIVSYCGFICTCTRLRAGLSTIPTSLHPNVPSFRDLNGLQFWSTKTCTVSSSLYYLLRESTVRLCGYKCKLMLKIQHCSFHLSQNTLKLKIQKIIFPMGQNGNGTA